MIDISKEDTKTNGKDKGIEDRFHEPKKDIQVCVQIEQA